MTDKATRDKIAAARVSARELALLALHIHAEIKSFANLAHQSLPDICAALPAEMIDQDTKAVLVRLRLESANGATVEGINAFMSILPTLERLIPPCPPRSGAAIKRAEKKSFKRQFGMVTP